MQHAVRKARLGIEESITGLQNEFREIGQKMDAMDRHS